MRLNIKNRDYVNGTFYTSIGPLKAENGAVEVPDELPDKELEGLKTLLGADVYIPQPTENNGNAKKASTKWGKEKIFAFAKAHGVEIPEEMNTNKKRVDYLNEVLGVEE